MHKTYCQKISVTTQPRQLKLEN